MFNKGSGEGVHCDWEVSEIERSVTILSCKPDYTHIVATMRFLFKNNKKVMLQLNHGNFA